MTFEVETPSLNSTVKSMESELGKIADVSKRLYAALTALDGMWVGPAHETFAKQYMSDQQMLTEMSNTVSRVIEGMESARKTYEQCEQSVKTEIRRISI